MQLIQLLLPLYDNQGEPFPQALFERVRQQLTEKFGGVTAYVRSPAKGLWKEDDGTVVRDDVVMYEVMADTFDRSWWNPYRDELKAAFAQDELVVRALPCARL